MIWRSLRQSIGCVEAFGRQAIKIYRHLARVPLKHSIQHARVRLAASVPQRLYGCSLDVPMLASASPQSGLLQKSIPIAQKSIPIAQ
jgi:hypothetical protein